MNDEPRTATGEPRAASREARTATPDPRAANREPRTLVIGAGKSGVAAANHLAGQGSAVVLADACADPELPYALDGGVVRAFGRSDL